MDSSDYQSAYYETVQSEEEANMIIQSAKNMKPSAPMRQDSSKPHRSPRREPMCAKLLPEDLFRRGLERWLPRPNDPLADRKILLDAVFLSITQLLVDYGKPKWSLRPRTFSILWVLGIPEVMDVFVAEGRTDHYLPYNEGNLPAVIGGSALRSRFLRLQNIVRCRREDVVGLEEGGNHVHLPGDADSYFHSMSVLGRGKFAVVDSVRSRRSLQLYTRKRIPRGQSAMQDVNRIAAFEKELVSLKTLSHRHVVKLVGSYTDSENLGLIMSPIADVNLQEYLVSTEIDAAHRKRMLRSFFGCLVTALAYIHSKNVRHKDIKPLNVLVKGENILLADFGTSRICLDGHLTTNGQSQEGTPRYWAPEVLDGADRNGASDIWSLGCVFLEMATILFGRTHRDMAVFYSENGNENNSLICLNPAATELWIAELRKTLTTSDAAVLDWTAWMLQPKPNDRPTAAQLRGAILDTESQFDYICPHCASSQGMRDCHGPLTTEKTELQEDSQLELTETTLPVEISSDLEEVDEGSALVPAATETTIAVDGFSPEEVVYGISELPQQHRDSHDGSHNLQKTPSEPQKSKIKRVSFADVEGEEETVNPERFTGLPANLRPEPTAHENESEDEDDEPDFIAPAPIRPPPFHHSDCMPLPQASLVPSYLLAGTNHFSKEEINNVNDNPTTKNIFVYGRFMFPSLVHAVAAGSKAGAYSPALQRRIFPLSDDWGKANLSIQRATEIMTPARLRGYDRRRPFGQEYAAIQTTAHSSSMSTRPRAPSGQESPGEVLGFLLVGIKMEAVHYLDLLLTSSQKNLTGIKPQQDEGAYGARDLENESPLMRQDVTVDVELNTGEISSVDALTYVWRARPKDLRVAWDEEKFVRGRLFQEVMGSNTSHLREEKALASRMRISLSLIGDYLQAVVMKGDKNGLRDLLRRGWDANARCNVYGTALQAAVVVGNEDMVEMLLDHGAKPNIHGGRYGFPLIAAAYASRKSITRSLLKKNADVFAKDGVHVNALYQAVGHSDYAITEMLLENAAWLAEEWAEIWDLATETGDPEIQSLLRQYDVRHIHRQHLFARPDRFTKVRGASSTKIISAVIRKCAAAQTLTGNWKGRRGVAVTVAALNAGASISILPLLRQVIGPVKALIEILQETDKIEEEKTRRAIESGFYSDMESVDSDSEEESRPSRRKTGSKPQYRRRSPPRPMAVDELSARRTSQQSSRRLRGEP